MCDAVATIRPDCPSVSDDAKWCQMYETELLCGKKASDIPDALVDEVLREVASDAKISHLAPYMHQKHIVTDDEYQQLTSPQASDLQREKFKKILMKRNIQWLLEFCHCLLESYESERGLDIHHKLFQQIKGEVRSRLKVDLPEQVLIEAEDVVAKIKSISITQKAKKGLIQRLKLEGHRHLFENFKQVTTSDIADAWLAANKTRDWTILVEALLTEPGLGCAVSGVLPLSCSNPPAVWNYVRDIGKDWKNLAIFLGYSDSLISEIDSKSPHDVKSQIRNFMRVCLIPDCGEHRTEEIMDMIEVAMRPESQSDHKYVNRPEWKGPADSSYVMFGEQHQLVHLTDRLKGHHLTTKEADDRRVGQFPFDQPCPQVLTPDEPVMRVEDVSPEFKKPGTYRSEDFLSLRSHSGDSQRHYGILGGQKLKAGKSFQSAAVKTRQVQFDDSATCHNEDVHLINHQSVYETDVQKDNHLTTKEINEHQMETPNTHVPRMEGDSPEVQKASTNRSEDHHLTTIATDEHPVDTASRQVARMEDTSPESQKTSTDRSEADGQELLQACTSEQWDVAEALIVSGNTLEAPDKDGRTPLHICCIKGKMEMVKLLIEYGANITAKDKLDNCCLHHKETLKKPEISSLVILAFLQKGWSMDQLNKNDVTPLLVACQSGEICYQAALVLITHDARVDGLPTINEKPLICASASGNIKLVELLLTYGANINQGDGRDGSTALIQACLCNHPEIVRILLEWNANVNLADKDGTTALAAAVSKNAYGMVQMLIEKGGADVNCIRQRGGVVGSYEETPLAFSCAHGYRDVAELLIHNGANVNFLCSDAVPPIGFAIICKQHHMVKFLLEVEDYDKSLYGLRRAVEIAVRAENYASAKMLLDARGGPRLSLQEAQQNHLIELVGHIDFIQNLPESELEVEEPAVRRDQVRDQAVKVEEVLQTFSQICMSAITSNTNCEQLLEISKALHAPNHITSFIQEYSRGIQRQDILKAKFLGSDSGMSPANFFITHQFIDTGSFHAHAMEFFPDGTEKFHEELVWTFHQISGGEDLPFNANRVLERLFRGQFSLNVRTGTRGELKSQLPFQHHSWSQPQLLPTALSHEDHCVSTALPWPTRARATQPIPALPGPVSPGPTLRALPEPTLPGTTLPWPALPGPEQPGTELLRSEWPRPEPSKPGLNGVEMGQSSSTAFSFADSQPTKAVVLDEKQNEPEITSAELQQRVTSNCDSILKKQQSLPAKLPKRVLVNATMPNLKTKSYSSDPRYHFSEHEGSLQSPLQDKEETNENGGISESIPSRERTVNQNNIAGDSEPWEIRLVAMCPETPENERRNAFGEVETQRNPTRKMCKTTTRLPTADKKTGARKPLHGILKSAPQAMVKGYSKTPGAEGRHSQHLISDVTYLGEKIGEGAFGFVEKVKVSGKICAGKHFKDDRNYNEKIFLKEFKLVQQLKHDHIVYYYGYHILPRRSQRNKSPVLIMECLAANLHDFLLSQSHQDLPLARKVDLLCGISQGLNYLHSNSIIHRDLTATNVLLDSRAVPKISDFGNSCVTGTDLGSQLHSQSYRCYGTLNYMAPEAQSRKYGAEIDIFSFGHLSLFVGIQKSPNHLLPPNDPGDDDDDDSVRGRTEFERRREYFTLLYRKIEEKHPLVLLMKTCLRNKPKRRPKADELVSQLDAMCTELPPPPPLTVRIQKQRK